MFIINGAFSYPTQSSLLPDPLFRIDIRNIHKAKHGSDSGTYDTEGRFIPQKFEDIFAKYAKGQDKDGLTLGDLWDFHKGQRVLMDPFGWFAQIFECEFVRSAGEKLLGDEVGEIKLTWKRGYDLPDAVA
jgi:hypothetical protein